MANYIVNHQKKKNILEKRKQELGHVIRNNYDLDKIIRAVEKLRFAQLQVFKCELHKEPPQRKNPDKVEEAIQLWENYSIEEVIREFVKECLVISSQMQPEQDNLSCDKE